MRKSILREVLHRTRGTAYGPAHRGVGEALVAVHACTNLQCTQLGYAIRREGAPEVPPEARCSKCGRGRCYVREEFVAEVEVNARVGIVRFRRLVERDGTRVPEELGESAWTYVPLTKKELDNLDKVG